ncbi:MAG: polyketide synthase [Chloroflexi bacterium]|nr:polyketide synthase [Chloroflexota bacterium]
MMLANGEVDAVVVGAVDLAGSVENVLLRHQQAPVNNGSATMSIDQNANGWLIGEGAGVVVLKRNEDAVQNQDRVYAVIDDIAIVQGDSPQPSAESVARAARQALSDKDVSPTDIGYLELFGSGWRLRIRRKWRITAVYRADAVYPPTTALGSVKANIGHTFTASGIASLIKTAHCLYHHYLPATPGWTAPKSPELWQNGPFFVPTESVPWFKEAGQTQRLAAINGLGADGAYAHLILSEATEPQTPDDSLLQHTPFYLCPVAANDAPTLLQRLADLQSLLTDSLDLATPARSAVETAVSRNFHTYQQHEQETYALAIVGHNKEELLREVRLALLGLGKSFETGKLWKTPGGQFLLAQTVGTRRQSCLRLSRRI